MARKKAPLKKKDLEKQLAVYADWTPNKQRTHLSRTFEFPTFIAALAFVAKITVHAEILDHHPVIELSYGKVKIKLTTDEAGGLTKKDFELAKRIDILKVY